MSAIGIRDLKANTSQILRRVREKGETIDVTYHGEVVARLIPVKRPEPSAEKLEAIWSDWDQLAEEIGRHWTGEPSAVEAVSEGRR
jgi:prevent-host-death family protein